MKASGGAAVERVAGRYGVRGLIGEHEIGPCHKTTLIDGAPLVIQCLC